MAKRSSLPASFRRRLRDLVGALCMRGATRYTLLIFLGGISLILSAWGLSQIRHVIEPADWPVELSRPLRMLPPSTFDPDEVGGLPPPLFWARLFGIGFALVGFCVIWMRIFREETLRWRLLWLRRHVVICGLGRKGWALAQAYREGRHAVVVAVPKVSEEDRRRCRADGILLVEGDATEEGVLELVQAGRASRVFTVTPSDQTNLDIAAQVRELYRRQEREHRATCWVHVSDPSWRECLDKELLSEVAEAFEIRTFNLPEVGARMLFQEQPLECDDPDDVELDDRPVRLVLVGIGKTTPSLLRQAVLLGHYRNGLRLRVTLVGDSEKEVTDVVERCLNVREAADIEISVWSQNACHLPTFENCIFHQVEERLTVVVASDSDEWNVQMALALRDRDGVEPHSLCARVAERAGLAGLLREATHASRAIRVFGEIEWLCTEAAIERAPQDALARQIHDYYRRKFPPEPNATPTAAQRPWEQLTEDLRSANRAAADHIPVKLRALGVAPSCVDSDEGINLNMDSDKAETLARMEHARWCAERWLSGWRLGLREDARKRHPNLVPWEDLDEAAKDKDLEAVAALSEILDN